MSVIHGGDPAAVAARYGVDPSALIDFSANIAPHGPPPRVAEVLAAAARNPRILAPYPSPAYAALRKALAAGRGVTEDCIVIGHGASALIDAAVRTFAVPSWLVPVPAFSEYRRAIESAGKTFARFPLSRTFDLDVNAYVERLHSADAGALLNSPHNPSGAAYDRAALRAVADECERLQRPFVLDAAFVDYAPELDQPLPWALVIRSLTKFYALAGVRIGYAVAAPRLAARLRSVLPSWPVGTLDAALALAAIEDETYERATRLQTLCERERLRDAITAMGLSVLTSQANFLFVDLALEPGEVDNALEELVRGGVIVRDCRSFEGLERSSYVRIAVLARAQNERLLAALARIRR